MSNKVHNVYVDKEFVFNMYLNRLIQTSKTTFLISWPTMTLTADDGSNITQDKLIAHLRILLYKHQYYMRPLSAKKLRMLGFNAYGPTVAISANFTLNEFIDKFPNKLLSSLQPISVISDSIYYPSYPELAIRLPILNQVQKGFHDILGKPIRQNINVLRNISLYQETIIKNIIRLCINQQK